MNVIKSELLSKYNHITHGFVHDLDGFDIDNFAGEQSLDEIYFLKQIHSDNIVSFENSGSAAKGDLEGDSLITRDKRYGVSVFTADCVPIILFEKKSGYISAIHAGWRGTLKKIAAKTVNKIKGKTGFKSFEFIAAIGPSIGMCCYEVGRDVADHFISGVAENNLCIQDIGEGKFRVDLVNINRLQLLNSGVSEIDTIDICTKCNSAFPSYRRDGSNAKRMLSFIGLL